MKAFKRTRNLNHNFNYIIKTSAKMIKYIKSILTKSQLQK